MKSAFVKIILGTVLVTAPIQASMKDEADEEKSKFLQAKQVPVHTL